MPSTGLRYTKQRTEMRKGERKERKMKTLRKFLQKSERGQALAEYMPLMPPVLFLSVVILIPISENSSYIFCRMVNTMDPEKCTLTDESYLPDLEDDLCIPLNQEEGSSQCDQSDECSVLPGLNNASYTASEPIETFVIKAGKEYHLYEPGLTEDGCYYVDLNENHVSWEKVGHGSGCKDVSHAQAWKTALCLE
jgi:hypothetical protein